MQFNGTHKICQRCLKLLHRNGIKTTSVSRAINWKSKDVRKTFLDFFCNRYNHKFVPSSSVIPKKGEGTYFTNAGMNQFKPIFLGTVPAGSDLASYRRVANSQKCIRVGGKHNDLDDVGQDFTHHTFFEMMGSWSFGDYFKKEACAMALELLTDVYRLPIDRLYFTYFGGNDGLGLKEDSECREIWRELGVPASHILPFEMKDNFWDMGEVGPCGPCTEIHYDHIGGRDASHMVNTDSPEVVEIWNLVFMQFERQVDQSLRSLPRQHVDTGMGLERMCAVLQGTISNYNTDLFTPMFHWLHKMTGAPVYSGRVGAADVNKTDMAYRIIADHTRMFSVCIADGLLPARIGIEQKLRSLIHRSFQQYENALRGQPGTLVGLIPLVAESLGEAYPEISSSVDKIQEVYRQTEHKYISMIKAGRKQFTKFLRQHGNIKVLSGEHIKTLHEGCYGTSMSLDTIEDIAEVHGIALDLDDFHKLISQEKMMPILEQHNISPAQLSQTFITALHSSGISPTDDLYKYKYERSSQGYNFDECPAVVTALIADDTLVTEADVNDKITVVLDKTQFYSEAGGQMGDKGIIKTETGTVEVWDTQSSHGYILHHGTVTEGKITTTQTAFLHIDDVVSGALLLTAHNIRFHREINKHIGTFQLEKMTYLELCCLQGIVLVKLIGLDKSVYQDHRLCCMRNHTATHLVNAALRQVLGDVKQRGSSVRPDKLSFDFACVKSVSNKDLKKVEELVCNTISRRLPVERKTLPLLDALSLDGVVSLENEAYPSEVHVLSVIDSSETENVCQSRELCGGTHLHNTADIVNICISHFSGVAQGIKEIVCLTGPEAEKAIESGEKLKSLYKVLEEAVRNISDADKWSRWRNEINMMITDDFLPKLVRDEVRDSLNQLGTEISSKQNKLQVELLKKELSECMTDNTTSYVLRQTSMKTLKHAIKLLEGLEVRKPVTLIVEYTKGIGILLAVPKGSEAVRTLLCQEFEADRRVNVTENKDITVIRVKGKQSEVLVNRCEKVLNSFVTERVQTEIQ